MLWNEHLSCLPELFLAHERPHLDEWVIAVESTVESNGTLALIHCGKMLLRLEFLLIAGGLLYGSIADRSAIVLKACISDHFFFRVVLMDHCALVKPALILLSPIVEHAITLRLVDLLLHTTRL